MSTRSKKVNIHPGKVKLHFSVFGLALKISTFTWESQTGRPHQSQVPTESRNYIFILDGTSELFMKSIIYVDLL